MEVSFEHEAIVFRNCLFNALMYYWFNDKVLWAALTVSVIGVDGGQRCVKLKPRLPADFQCLAFFPSLWPRERSGKL